MSIKLYSKNPDLDLFQMPGGEFHITTAWKLDGVQVAYINGALPNDLIALSIWADAVHRDGGKPHLVIPYLPGARQDRRHIGEALSAKVYADLINRCQLEQVICVDPHSDVMPALINNCVILTAEEVIAHGGLSQIFRNNYDGIIIPDAGATKRCNKIADLLKLPTYQALKHRDSATGQLFGFTCEKLPIFGNFLVCDDICDGGGTFKGLAQATKLAPGRLGLYVTHGIFSGEIHEGASQLYKYYSQIYTTNSYPTKLNATYEDKFMRILTVFELESFLLGFIPDWTR